MWPLNKSKTESLPSVIEPPRPVYEPIPALSAVECRFQSIASDDQEILTDLWRASPCSFVLRFPGLGFATAETSIDDDGYLAVNWLNWTEADDDQQPRPVKSHLQSTGGIATEIKLPTLMLETVYRGLLFPFGEFDHIVVKATSSMDDDFIQRMWSNRPELPWISVGIGSRVRTPEGMRSPRLYVATGVTPDKKAIRRANFRVFKQWLRDPWGKARPENP